LLEVAESLPLVCDLQRNHVAVQFVRTISRSHTEQRQYFLSSLRRRTESHYWFSENGIWRNWIRTQLQVWRKTLW